MANKPKKTTRSSTRSKSSARPTKAAMPSAKTVAKADPGTPAIDAAVKKAAATPSRSASGAAGRSIAAQPTDIGNRKAAPVSGVTRPGPRAVNKKEFVGRVAKQADLRPNQVREITEAVLNELGKALSQGEELKLPGLGKVQVKRKKDVTVAEVMVCKVRRKKDEVSDTDPLAPAAE